MTCAEGSEMVCGCPDPAYAGVVPHYARNVIAGPHLTEIVPGSPPLVMMEPLRFIAVHSASVTATGVHDHA